MLSTNFSFGYFLCGNSGERKKLLVFPIKVSEVFVTQVKVWEDQMDENVNKIFCWAFFIAFTTFDFISFYSSALQIEGKQTFDNVLSAICQLKNGKNKLFSFSSFDRLPPPTEKLWIIPFNWTVYAPLQNSICVSSCRLNFNQPSFRLFSIDYLLIHLLSCWVGKIRKKHHWIDVMWCDNLNNRLHIERHLFSITCQEISLQRIILLAWNILKFKSKANFLKSLHDMLKKANWRLMIESHGLIFLFLFTSIPQLNDIFFSSGLGMNKRRTLNAEHFLPPRQTVRHLQ